MKAGIAGIGFALLGLWMLIGALKSKRKFDASGDWPVAAGVIESCEVARLTGQGGRSTLFVKYTFELDGHKRSGHRLALYTIADRGRIEELAERFTAGSKVPVYVEPALHRDLDEKKREAVLIPGPPPEKPWSGVILAGLAIVVGGAVSVGGFGGWLGD